MSNDHRDYEHAIWEIRQRLHDPRGSKAVVLVGSGFSRNAISCTSKHTAFPLWEQLTEGLVRALYPNTGDQERVIKRAGATSAALRLAQEFQTAFGRSRLIDFVRDAIRDDEYQPSRLHCDLLELPWADVFTTNYDRLLEKANGSLWTRHYDNVYAASDLPLARRPRIVKLHGSLPALEHLVLTEEDYRNYRRNYAPFVAAVQSALTENVLCLVGFSGDDPNFLAWSGWLRDELRNSVPKTYLFTGDEMKPFQRQLLEERYIIPIPLRRLANTRDYQMAYRWLFEQLAQRPEECTPSWNVVPQQTISRDDPSVAQEPLSPDSHDWIDTAILWRSHRRQYKGWYALHRDATERLWSHTQFWIGSLGGIEWENWPEATCIFVLRELIWRWSTAMRPLYDQIVFNVLDPQTDRFARWRRTFRGARSGVKGKERETELSVAELDDAYRFIMQECLRHARETGDNERFERLLAQLKKQHSDVPPDLLNDRQSFVYYQDILHSLGSLKYATARRQLETWNTAASAPIWGIRRAGLCLECDLVALGKSLLNATLTRLRSVPVSAALDLRDLSSEGITLYLLAMAHASEELIHQSHSHATKNVAAAPTAGQHGAGVTQAIDEPTGALTSFERPSAGPTAFDDSASGAIQDASRRQIRERLTKMTDYGCNPADYMEWLELATSPQPTETQGYHQREGFEIGNVGATMAGGTERQLDSAYLAMRFIEDTGLPLKMTLPASTMTIAGNLFRNAARTIGFFAAHEAVGLVRRSRESKLVEEVFTRECLARLSEAQVTSLADSTIQAVWEAVNHLEPPTRPIDAKDHFWEEQFQVACEALGRVVVRLPADRIVQILRDVVDLPQHRCITDSRWRRDPLAKCLRRIGGAIEKRSARSLLPVLLRLPVQGNAELPIRCDWYDPVSIVAESGRTRDTEWVAECDAQVDKIIASIAVARGEERANLCHRAVDLLWANLLSAEQLNALASSLYAYCDRFGLPAETGCYDSLVLSLPCQSGKNERRSFCEKYLSGATTDSKSWQNLRRTRSPIDALRPRQQREIEWLPEDLQAVLSVSTKWLESLGPLPLDEHQSASRQFWLNFAGGEDSPASKQKTLCDWLATLETLVLLNRQATKAQLDQADTLIAKAHRGQWCVTQVISSRAMLGKVTTEEAITEVQSRLADRDSLRVRQACDAMLRWCELDQSRDFSVPQVLLQSLGSMVAVHRHESLPLLIAASADIMEWLDKPRRESLIFLMESGLEALLSETNYVADHHAGQPYTIGMKLRIRVACARLAVTAAGLGISRPVLSRWITAVSEDTFADVRRHAVTH